MKALSLKEVRSAIRSLLEAEERRWIPASKNSPGRYETIDNEKEKVEKAPESQRMSHVQRFEKDVEAWIEHMSSFPEFESLRTFQTTKLDDEDFGFDFMELNALARSLWRGMMGEERIIPPHDFIKKLRQNLIDYGFEFKPRGAMKLPRSGKNSHGTHPFAGMGGGGSGFGMDGSVGGRGPGNMGGKYDWDPSDRKNLPMGAGKDRKK